jgi:hypothetical protein
MMSRFGEVMIKKYMILLGFSLLSILGCDENREDQDQTKNQEHVLREQKKEAELKRAKEVEELKAQQEKAKETLEAMRLNKKAMESKQAETAATKEQNPNIPPKETFKLKESSQKKGSSNVAPEQDIEKKVAETVERLKKYDEEQKKQLIQIKDEEIKSIFAFLPLVEKKDPAKLNKFFEKAEAEGKPISEILVQHLKGGAKITEEHLQTLNNEVVEKILGELLKIMQEIT